MFEFKIKNRDLGWIEISTVCLIEELDLVIYSHRINGVEFHRDLTLEFAEAFEKEMIWMTLRESS